MTSCSAVDKRNCQDSGAQSPQEFLSFGILISGCGNQTTGDALDLWAHPYLADSQILPSRTLLFLKSITWVYPQAFGKHLTKTYSFYSTNN